MTLFIFTSFIGILIIFKPPFLFGAPENESEDEHTSKFSMYYTLFGNLKIILIYLRSIFIILIFL